LLVVVAEVMEANQLVVVAVVVLADIEQALV
jgi:hypothetical protein